jgi:chromosome segregation ATPase
MKTKIHELQQELFEYKKRFNSMELEIAKLKKTKLDDELNENTKYNDHVESLHKVIQSLEEENQRLKNEVCDAHSVIEQLKTSTHYKEFCDLNQRLNRLKKPNVRKSNIKEPLKFKT